MEVSGCFKKYVGRDEFLNVDFGHDRIHFGPSNSKTAFVSDDASAYIEKRFPGEFRTIADPETGQKLERLEIENAALKAENKKLQKDCSYLEVSVKNLHEALNASKDERKKKNG